MQQFIELRERSKSILVSLRDVYVSLFPTAEKRALIKPYDLCFEIGREAKHTDAESKRMNSENRFGPIFGVNAAIVEGVD